MWHFYYRIGGNCHILISLKRLPLELPIETRLLDEKDAKLAETFKVMDTRNWPQELSIMFVGNEMRILASRYKLNERQLITEFQEYICSRALPGSFTPLNQLIISVAILSNVVKEDSLR